MIQHQRNINMYPGVRAPERIHLSQYDSDFTLVFSLYSSAGSFTLESGTTAMIRGTKGDGNGYSASASLSGTTVTVQGNNQMTAAAGPNTFELVLTRSGKVLSTANFILDVEPAAMDADTIQSETVLKELQAIIDSASTSTAAATRAEEAAQEAEGHANGTVRFDIVQSKTEAEREQARQNIGFETDNTLTVQGVAADAKKVGDEITGLKDDLNDLEEEVAAIEPGLSDDARTALLNCFAHAVFTDDDADYYGILRNALYTDAYPRLTAIFNPGTHNVYQGDALDTLKPYLVVKYFEDSSSTGTVIAGSAYTLSGTLVEGDQTITVSYSGLRATFTVSVSNPFIYRLPNTPITFDGNTGIDTGIALLSKDRSFTLAWEYVDRRDYTHDTTQNYPFACYLPNSPYTGIFMQIYDGGVGSTSTRRKIRHVLRCTPPGTSGGGQVVFDNDIAEADVVGRIIRFCFRYDNTTGTVKALLAVNKGTVTRTSDSVLYTYTSIDNNLIIGARKGTAALANFMLGVCNDFKVFNSVLSDAEMQAYVEGVA